MRTATSTERAQVAAHGRLGRGLSLKRKEELWGFLFISPWLIGFLVFALGPMLVSLYYSFNSYDMLSPPKWIGFDNYKRMFTADISVVSSITVTLQYIILFVLTAIPGSLAFALLLNRQFRGRTFARAVFYLPSITPVIATIFVWRWMLNVQYGPVNSAIASFGIAPPAWFNSTQSANFTLVLFSLWAYVGGGPMVVFLAALQSIPQALYEAAEIDGAGPWRKFWAVTIPMLTPTIFYSLILAVIGSFQVFDAAYVGTQGGPGRATNYYLLYVFKQAFQNFDMGYASSLGWILALVLLGFTALQFKLQRYWVYYETER